jgi:hypothetical protein
MLSNLEPYMFSNTNIIREDTTVIPKKTYSTKLELNNKANKDSSLFEPRKRDSLFWCFYIAFFGQEKFMFLSNYFIEENKFKIETVEKARKEKPILKNYKIRVAIFETDMLMEKKIKVDVLQALCVLYQVNVIYLKHKSYLDFRYYPENPTFLIKETKIGTTASYSIKKLCLMDDIKDIRSKYWCQESINKPLRAISNYKVDDLQEIAVKLNISINKLDSSKKKTKPELYKHILDFLD